MSKQGNVARLKRRILRRHPQCDDHADGSGKRRRLVRTPGANAGGVLIEQGGKVFIAATEQTVYYVEEASSDGSLSEEEIEELVDIAQGTSEYIQSISPNWQAWSESIQTSRETRLQSMQDIAAEYVPEDRRAALNETINFADAVHNALGDYSINEAELLNIAQIGANAVAGLEAHGGPKLQSLAGNIDKISNNLALGQTPNAIDNLGSLEGSLHEVPNFEMPDRPEFSPPEAPSIPQPGGGRGRK